MDIETDLLRVLWHELGHLCVDIVDTDEILDYQIEDFWVSYHPMAISVEKWAGAVKMVPPIKFEGLVDKNDKMSYAFISLISGCVFQTVFFEKVLNVKVDFGNCFGFRQNCAGLGDCGAFNTIGIHYRKKYGNRSEFTYFVNKELVDIYMAEVSKNIDFLNGIEQIAIQYKDIIIQYYKEDHNKEAFRYSINNENLQNLKFVIYELLISSGFYVVIQNLKNLIKSALEKDKEFSIG